MERRGLGQEAEEVAVNHLVRSGYRICARNFLARGGELDIVAEKDGVVAFVEVRMRSSAAWGDPSQTVTRAKQQKVVRAAMQFLQRAGPADRMVRFDVISIVGRGGNAQVEHIPNAFDAGM